MVEQEKQNVAPKDWYVNDPDGHAAFELVQVYKNHVSEDGELSDEGGFWMGEIFGRVPEERRANVFIEFLGILDEEGIDYDKSMFNVEAVKDEVHYNG